MYKIWDYYSAYIMRNKVVFGKGTSIYVYSGFKVSHIIF